MARSPPSIERASWSRNHRGLQSAVAEVFNDKKDNQRAIAEFDSAIRLDPTYATAYSNRAYAYFRKGDLDRPQGRE
jgi:tetratricopeptide (TPR) repeat protein